ncbi:MAG TPA: hypothetical protein VMH81_00460 [Bryobacteraceae bacterium]|nr:hypothetical protein [Bryobacteraceae bacterium]
MTRERKTHLATVAVLMAALGVVLGQKAGWRLERTAANPPSSPQDAIYKMLDAARSGNVSAYLASYTGPMRESLQQSVRESSEAAFAGYLRDSNSAIKGVAVSEPQTNGGNEASVRVEYVYQDRNEVQIMHLEKAGSEWRISRVEGAERIKTLIPYGTPVR